MPSLDDIEAFRKTIANLEVLAAADVTAEWRKVANERPDLMQAYLLDVVPNAVEPYIIGSAEMATAWYDELAPDAEYTAVAADPPPNEQIEASIRWAAGPAFGRGTASVLDLLIGSMQRYVQQGARDTIVQNAESERVRWARHASANACAFCRMLAGRGAVYTRRDRAMAAHDHCHCMPVPIRPGNPYRPAPYVAEWVDEYNAARSASDGTTAGILAWMRRND